MTGKRYMAAKKDENLELIEPTKPPFGYYGAKQRISSSIIELLPPHNAWVEVFCGSAAITLAKKPAGIEVINDLDGNIVNLFEQLRNNYKKLVRAVELTPYAREEFQKARITNNKDSNLERARKFLVTSMMTINATVGDLNSGFSYSMSYTRGGREARVNRWVNLPERISRVVERIRYTRVENRDARKIVELFSDRPATLMYLDPPYFVKRSHDYCVDAKDKEFHEELLELCCESKAMIMMSNYDNSLYRKHLNRNTGWTRKLIHTTTRDTSGRDMQRKEVIWMNENLMNAKKNNKVPIRLKEKEKKYGKINPPRK